MAMPVEFRQFTPKNSREDLIRKLEQAPQAHAEALLAGYELLQRLHDKGLLDVANGLLCAGDTVVDRVVDAASSKEAVTALRIGLMFSNLLGTLDADRMHALLTPAAGKPPSLWAILKSATSENARAGMAAAVGLLTGFGAALRGQRKT
jgi:uncharacterized protein YjgD (DUF1641 family)